jgi:hypothetical protein
MLDGNADMRRGEIYESLTSCHLREVILKKHGSKYPSTYHRNLHNVPIDRIWASPGLQIMRGGYFDFDSVFINTDHCTLWIDISFITAFGRNMPAIVKPHTRRLHCRDPRVVWNFTSTLEKFLCEHKLLEHASSLQAKTRHSLSWELQQEYERMDALCCKGVSQAEPKCRKLMMGQVAYSPQVQSTRGKNYAWSLLQKEQKILK